MTFSAVTLNHEAPRAPQTAITKLGFRNRFTLTEKTDIELAAIDDPAADVATRRASATIRAMLKDLDSASFIDLSRPDTIAGVQLLETMGVLGAGRAAQVLSTDIADIERVPA